MNIQTVIRPLSAIVERIKIAKRHMKYAVHFKRLLALQHIDNSPVPGEEEYIRFWKRLYPHVEPYSYRLFRHYCGDTPYIVPEDIGHSFIETKLNPNRYLPFYDDKNMLSMLLPASYTPQTILYRVCGGRILNERHQVSGIDADSTPQDVFSFIGGRNVILKQSIDSNSGRNLLLFKADGDRYVSYDGKVILDGHFLIEFGRDWVIQEVVKQHQDLSRFCSSSVNTLRISTYRSVKDEQIYIISAVIRIGKQGSVVDNLHQGGGMVGINVATGELKHEVIDQYANRTTTLNEINFAENTFLIPHWTKLISFCKEVASRNHHCRLIALDVTLTEDGTPKLIEWNVMHYSYAYWIPMLTGVTPFGDKTEEIVEYCMKKN